MKDSALASSSDAPLLEVKNLCYRYPDSLQEGISPRSPALDGVSFSLSRGEKLALIGANGSGKSTLLMHLAGCFPLSPRQGEIFLSGVSAGSNVERLRSVVGLIFQEPDDQLFMPRVLEDVAFGLVSRGMDVTQAHGLAMETLSALLISHLADRPPHRLSGGEKRLVALAGILVMRPEIVVLDEPSAALDPRAKRRVIEALRALEQPLILATHDLDLALDLCNRVLILNRGRVAVEGPPSLLRDEKILEENYL